MPLTDSVRSEAKTISISGKIVNTKKYKSDTIISKLEKFRTKGTLIKYIGRNTAGNYLIQSFNTSHPNTNWGGADFSMELVEVRIAKSAYNVKKKDTQATQKKNNPTLKAGAIVVFKGGNVYVSSDAKTPAAKRGRSTCKIEIPNSNSKPIRTESWAIHTIHLVSTDGKMVYGWVDKANIEGTGSSSGGSGTSGKKGGTNTSANTNAGTQQVKSKNTNKKTVMKQAGKLSAQLIVGSTSYLNKNTVTINNTKYYKNGDKYYPISYVKTVKYDGGRSTGQAFPIGTPYFKKG